LFFSYFQGFSQRYSHRAARHHPIGKFPPRPNTAAFLRQNLPYGKSASHEQRTIERDVMTVLGIIFGNDVMKKTPRWLRAILSASEEDTPHLSYERELRPAVIVRRGEESAQVPARVCANG